MPTPASLCLASGCPADGCGFLLPGLAIDDRMKSAAATLVGPRGMKTKVALCGVG